MKKQAVSVECVIKMKHKGDLFKRDKLSPYTKEQTDEWKKEKENGKKQRNNIQDYDDIMEEKKNDKETI